MEINYNTIVKYLCSDKLKANDNDDMDENIFLTIKNIMVSSDKFKFTNMLKDISKKTFYRYGVTRYNDNIINISFITSLLTLINKNFVTMDVKDELIYIDKFLQNLKTKIIGKFKFELSKFQKPILVDRLLQLNFDDGIIIQALSQIIGINFLIFDYKNDIIETIFSNNNMNPWKVTIMLAKYNNDWEPLFCDKKLFSFNDNFIKKILTTYDIKYYNSTYLGKDYSLIDNIDILIEEANITDGTVDSTDGTVDGTVDSTDNTINMNNTINSTNNMNNTINSMDNIKELSEEIFINPLDEIKKMKLNKTQLKKLKKADIFDIIKKLNLDINENDNKQLMIDTIMPYV